MWAIAADHERDLVAGWLRDGLNWRAWTAKEMTWVLYQQITQSLKPRDRRALFVLAGDKAAVAALDRETLNQTKTPDYQDIPVRGSRG